MDILEIVRLSLSKSGIGLLPFCLAGTLVALVMLAARYKGHKNRKGVATILVVYWILLTKKIRRMTETLIPILHHFELYQVSALISVEKSAKARGDKGPSKYPISDKSLDNYVILGLYAVFTFYEAGQLVRRSARTAEVYEQNGSSQGRLGKDGY
ncbi:BQ5605_C050g12493 [Microbotryum silenes-dioicae]|uniref:BQ5605_C050g12493 protein n=1 Tax=Microbotryum silenes-dioicae TaxID=796604 RepID=A0A2X0PHB5_9BASI|nr:BQ5605_C050g12493 [Microbotryum silenes-dioicae]